MNKNQIDELRFKLADQLIETKNGALSFVAQTLPECLKLGVVDPDMHLHVIDQIEERWPGLLHPKAALLIREYAKALKQFQAAFPPGGDLDQDVAKWVVEVFATGPLPEPATPNFTHKRN